MDLTEAAARLATHSIPLLPHQARAIESDADVVVLSGDSATGKTFAAIPWLLSREPKSRHALFAPAMRLAEQGVLFTLLRYLRLIDIEFVYGKVPPKSWAAAARGSCRQTLTVRGGASVLVASIGSARQIQGVRLDSAFIDAAETFVVDFEDVARIVEHSAQTVLTSYNGTGSVLALRKAGITRQTEIIYADSASALGNVPHLSRVLAGERIAAEVT